MTHDKGGSKTSTVPRGSFARLVGLGSVAAGVGGRMLLGAGRQMAAGQRPKMSNLLLTSANAHKVTGQLAQMRGAALKIGQLMSMDTGALLPPEFTQILSRLRAEADYMPPHQVRQVLDGAWGKGWISKFSAFNVRPIAAASIGQVHRAQTKDGRDLAIKVQYPGVRQSIDSDVKNVSALLRLSGLLPKGMDMKNVLEEARAHLHEEADYVREAAHLGQFADLLAKQPAYIVPRPHLDLSGADVLAMDYIDSTSIEELAAAAQPERDRVMSSLINLVLQEFFTFNMMQTDPNFGNFRYDAASQRVVLLDFGSVRSFSPALVSQFRTLIAAPERESLRHAAIDIGYFTAATQPNIQEALLDMIGLALSPLHSSLPFSFATSDLVPRLRDMGLALGMDRQFAHIPPTDVLFLHRKIGGLFLLAHRLGAHIPLGPLMEEFVIAERASAVEKGL